MTTRSAPYYWLTCDGQQENGETCGVKSTEGGDFAAWGDDGMAESEALDRGWAIVDGPDGGTLHFCEDCRSRYVCGECREKLAGDSAKDRDGMYPECWGEDQASADPAAAAGVAR